MITPKHNDVAVWWEGPLAVDADGAPNAYNPDHPADGLDYLADAGGPSNYYGVVTDQHGVPVKQGPNDPYPGDWISTTALGDHTKAVIDPTRYVDSSKIPYVSIPGNAPAEYGIHPGDVAFVWCRATGQASPAIVADIGPKNKWGEASIALTGALGLNNSARHGGTDHGVVVVVFKGSSKGWPRTVGDIATQVNELLDATGGATQYEAPILQ